jgi:hypothetical protein
MTRDTRHDSEDVVGRITTRGQWDRRYIPKADPCQDNDGGWREVVTGVAVMLLCFVGLGMWAWIAWAAAQ